MNNEIQTKTGVINVYKSPTGSGKTFSIMTKAIEDAKNGGIAVICFPNLNLLGENMAKLKKEDLGYKYNIEVVELSLSSYGKEGGINTSEDILNKLAKGRLIVITLHSYITQRGDFGNYSYFFMVLQFFRSITTLYIDEAHLLFDSYNKSLKLTNLVSKTKGSYRIIYSGKKLEESIKKDDCDDMLLQDNLFYKKEVSVSINDPLYEVGSIEKSTLSDTSKDFLLQSKAPNIFLTFNDLKILKKEGLFLDTNFYNLFFLSLTGDLEKDNKIQKFLSSFYLKIFNYNCYITIMETENKKRFHKLINTAFNNNNQSFDYKKLAEQVALLNSDLTQSIMASMRQIQNRSEATQLYDIISNNIKTLSYDFCNIAGRCDKINLECIYPESPIEALSMNYVQSINTFVLNYKPYYTKKTDEAKESIRLKSNEQYKKIVLEKAKTEASSKMEPQDGSIQKKKSNVNNESSDDESEGESYFVSDDDQHVEQSEYKLKQLENEKERLAYINAPPFTSGLNDFFLGDFNKYIGFKEVNFFSATYSNPNVNNLKNNLENIGMNFLEFKTERKKLNKLYLIQSSIDWFASSDANWKSNWASFAEYFHSQFIENQAEENKKFALLLAPSNSEADRFYKYKVIKPNDKFSLVKGSFEKSDDVRSPIISEYKDFSTKPSKTENRTIRIGSIISTVAVGLNMPEHSFILAAANNFKPVSVIWKYGDIPTCDARNYETTLALIQAIGRNARRSKLEEDANLYTARCVLISKSDVFPNIMESLAKYSSQFYEDVEILNLTQFEKLLSVFNKSKKIFNGYTTIEKVKSFDNDMYKYFFPFGQTNNVQDVRFNLIKIVLNSLQNKDCQKLSEVINDHIVWLCRYKFAGLCGYLTEELCEFVENKV